MAYNAYDTWKKNQESKNSYNALDIYRRKEAERSSVDLADRIQDLGSKQSQLVNEYNSRFFDADGNYKNSGYRSDASSALSQYVTNKSSYDAQSKLILKELSQYESYLNSDYVSSIRSQLENSSKVLQQIQDSYQQDSDYWSQWETEDDYNNTMAALERTEGQKTADLDTLLQELEPLERAAQKVKGINALLGSNNAWDSFSEKVAADENDFLSKKEKALLQSGSSALEFSKENENKKSLFSAGSSTQGLQSLTQPLSTQKLENEKAVILSQYGYTDADELFKDASSKRQYYNQASYIQKGIKMAAVSDPDSDEYDPKFEARVSEGKKLDSENLNSVSTTRTTGVAVNPNNGQQNKAAYYMTDEEYDIYCYWLSQNEEKAKEYLDVIEETINAREAEKIVNKIGDSIFLKEAFAVAAGLDQFGSGIENLFDDRDYIPSSSIQIAGGQIRESLENVGPEFLGNSLGQTGYDALNTISNMLPTVLLSAVTGGGAAGAVVGNVALGASAGGNARQQMINLGYSKEQANSYAVLVGASESGLQYLLGGIGKLGGKLTSNAVSNMVQGIDNGLARASIKFGASLASEGLEESIQEVLEPFFQNITVYADNRWEDIDWQQVAYAGVLGALTAGMLEGPSFISTSAKNIKSGNKVIASGQISNLVELGKSFPEGTEAHQLANRITESADTYTVGALLHEVAASDLSAVNMADIARSLEEQGIAPDNANTIVKWLNKELRGEELTESQREALYENEIIVNTVSEVINNANRRSKYDSILDGMKSYSDSAVESTESTSVTPFSSKLKSQAGNEATDFSVSGNGLTVNTKTGETVTISEIASVDNGELKVRLDNGEVVNADSLTLGNADDAVIYSALQDMEINVDGANDLFQAYDPTVQSAEEYARGIAEAYLYGMYDYGKSNIPANGFAMDLTAEQLDLAYQHGRIDGHAKYAREQQAIENGEVTIETEEGELFSQPEEDEKKVARRKKSVYNEFMTIAMQWAYNDSVQPGETKTIYDGRRKRYITIEKTTNNNFKEITIEKMEEDIYGRRTQERFSERSEEMQNAKSGNDDDANRIGNRQGTPGDAGLSGREQLSDGSEVNQSRNSKIYSPSLEARKQVGERVSSEGERRDRSDIRVRQGYLAGRRVTSESSSHIVFEGNRSELNRVQRVSLKVMEQLAEAFQIDFHVFSSFEEDGVRRYVDENGEVRLAPNGKYNRTTGAIYVDLNAGDGGRGTMLYTVAHELSHLIRQWAPVKFETMAHVLMEEYGNHRISAHEQVMKKLDKAEQSGNALSYDVAYEEMVADSLESVLTNSDFSQVLAKIKKQDTGLWNKIKQFFADILGAVKKVYARYAPHSEEGRMVAKWKKELETLQALFWEGMNEASENLNRVNEQAAEAHDVSTQENNSGKYTYETLTAKPDMVVTPVQEPVSTNRADIIAEAKKNASRVGKFNTKDGSVSVRVADIDTDVIITKRSLVHGLDRRLSTLAPVTVNVGEILKNSIRINELTPRASNVNNSYILMGAARDLEGKLYVVDFVVNQYSNEISKIDILYSVNAKRKETAASLPKFTNKVATPTVSTISISNLLEYVNRYFPDILPEDVLRHYGYTERPNGALGESALYQQRDAEREAAFTEVSEQIKREDTMLENDVSMLRKLQTGLKKVTQSVRTHNKVFSKSSLETMARKLMRQANARGDVNELSALINEVYSFIINGEDVSWESIRERAQDSVSWLMQHEQHEQKRDEYADEILAHLRTLRVSLNEFQKQEAKQAYGSYAVFRQKAMGKVAFVKDGVPLDMAWQELCELYPSFFDREISTNDQPLALMEVLDELKNSYVEEYYFQDEMHRQELFEEIYDGYWNVTTLHTMADTHSSNIALLRIKHRQQMDRLRESHARKEAELRRSQTVAVEKLKETRERRTANDRLQKLTLKTIKWLTEPSKQSVRCPDFLRESYAEFLSCIDFSSKRFLKTDGADPTINDKRMIDAMNELSRVVERARSGEDGILYDIDLPEEMSVQLKQLADIAQEKMTGDRFVVQSMHSSELKALIKQIRTINHAIRQSGILYQAARFSTAKQLSENSVSFLKSLGTKDKISEVGNFFTWKNTLPYYAFQRFGESGKALFEELMDAQDKLAFLAKDIFDFKEKTWSDKEAKAWSNEEHTISLSDEKSVTLTVADAMSLYCLSRRDNGYGLNHLLGGGIRVEGRKKRLSSQNDSRVEHMTPEDIQTICSSLTGRQKKVAESIQEFMSTVCAEWGNEISMKRYLTRDFTEKQYFPIETNPENHKTTTPQTKQADLYRLLNISATKRINPDANCSVIIRNIFDVFTNHSTDMARLNSFGLALLDVMKWLNYTDRDISGDSNVRRAMQEAFGSDAEQYIQNLILDINGRPSDSGGLQLLSRMTSMAKTAAVGANLRVALLQCTALPRASLVLSQRNILKGLRKKPSIEKAKKYCGIALWKSFGFYDTNISRNLEDQIRGTENKRQKAVELSLKGAEWGDAITWGWLWNACEYEVAQSNDLKIGSEEFNAAVAKKLREVVYATQVVDSTLTRSQMMRSKNGLTQTATAFMSEPTMSYNILLNAAFKVDLERRKLEAKTGNKTEALLNAWKKAGGYFTKSMAVYMISQLVPALAEGLMDAWRDDDDEKFSKKFSEAFVENLVTDMSVLDKLPLVSDAVEMGLSKLGMGYYSSDRLETTALSDLSSAIDAWTEILWNDNSNATCYAALYKTVKVASSATGLPLANTVREAVTLWNNTAGAIDPYLKVRKYQSMSTHMAIVENAFEKGDTTTFETAINKMIEEKMEGGKSRKEAQSVVRARFTATYKYLYVAAYQKKDTDEMARIRKLLFDTGVYGSLSELDVTLQKWRDNS